MKDFYLYILRCSDGSYYTGHTDDIDKRLNEHSIGHASKYTRERLPVKLVFLETSQDRNYVFQAERKIKKWTRKKKEVLIKHGWSAMKSFAKKWK